MKIKGSEPLSLTKNLSNSDCQIPDGSSKNYIFIDYGCEEQVKIRWPHKLTTAVIIDYKENLAHIYGFDRSAISYLFYDALIFIITELYAIIEEQV